jgi:(p)ppGpp synthase/HD superfamily hydrolase
MNKFDKMRTAMRYWLHGKGYHNAVRAMEYAYKHHTGIRKDGITPEFHHQVSIASYLRTLPGLKYQEEVLAVAFLHDIVEDYGVNLKVISAEFGEEITKSVKILTKKSMTETENFELDVEVYFDKMSDCPIASVVKGGDRIHNFQTMIDVFTVQKKQDYISECETYILPMLKEARRRFPEQEPAYENIKLVLMSQIELVNVSLSAMGE